MTGPPQKVFHLARHMRVPDNIPELIRNELRRGRFSDSGGGVANNSSITRFKCILTIFGMGPIEMV